MGKPDHLDPLEVGQQRPKRIHMQGLLCLDEMAYLLHALALADIARAWTPKDLTHSRVNTKSSAS
jgi:hypothetical protein